MERFVKPSFESTDFLAESVVQPKIKAGGSSNSSILNNYFNSLCQDLALMLTRTNLLVARADRLSSGIDAQTSALIANFQSVSTRVDAASGYSQVMADIHSSFYVNTGSTRAELSTIFGQATLPVRSSTDLLLQEDVYGNKLISPEVEMSYALGSTPGTLDYTVDPDAIEMLKENRIWLRDATSSSIWIKLKAPLQYRGLTPNVLELRPFPALGLNLLSVSYQKAGDSFSSTWYNLDLSYLPQYNTTSGKVEKVGPVRLFLPNEPISQIRINLEPRSNIAWGLHKLKVYHTEYDSSGTLVVQDPYGRSVSSLILKGKDPSTVLSLLRSSILSNQVQVNLTTTDNTITPVITGIILAV